MNRDTFSLNIRQKINRAYGIWWDIINTGAVVFILACGFIAFSLVIITGRVDLLPLQDTLWKQFIETVPPQKQSELGLGLLSVSISAASAAALYLIRIGTTRWANNRRIGFIHAYFAEAILNRCFGESCGARNRRAVLHAFLDSSMKVFEQISETHPRAQYFFEHARMKSHIVLHDGQADPKAVRDIAIDLFAAAVVCKKEVSLACHHSEIFGDIEGRLAY